MCPDHLVSDEDLYKKLLRIGSLDYEALPMVKRYTLDQKVKEVMDGLSQSAGRGGEANKLDDQLQSVKMRTQCIYTLRRITRDDKVKAENERYNVLLKDLHPNNP